MEVDINDSLNLGLKSEDPGIKKNKILAIQNEKERDRQCALWACLCDFDDPQFPPNPPVILQERRREIASLKPGEYINEDPAFWKEYEVDKFLNEKWTINLKNKVNYEHLIWVKDHLNPTDTEYLVKVRNKIYDYKQFFDEEKKREKPFRTLMFVGQTMSKVLGEG